LRLATVYALLAALAFYLQINASEQLSALWRPDRLVLASLLGTGWGAFVLAPLLIIVPLGMAWLAGSVAGALTGLLAWLFSNRAFARWWGMFCFSIPPLIFHAAANLRPNLILGEHWLNSYWFWVGLPSLIAVLIGGWVGEHLSTQRRTEQYVQ
jgi:Na+/proline symporter